MTLMLILALTLALFGPAVLASVSRPSAHRRLRPGALLLSHLALWALAGLCMALVLASGALKPAALGWVRPEASTLVVGLGLAAYFVLVHGPLATKALARLGGVGFEEGLARLSHLPTPILLAAVVSGGIVEELLYRSIAIAALEHLTGSVAVAVAISTLVFALAHVPLWGWLASFTIGAAGMVFALVFVWNRDLGVVVIAHVLTDLVGIALALRAGRRSG